MDDNKKYREIIYAQEELALRARAFNLIMGEYEENTIIKQRSENDACENCGGTLYVGGISYYWTKTIINERGTKEHSMTPSLCAECMKLELDILIDEYFPLPVIADAWFNNRRV